MHKLSEGALDQITKGVEVEKPIFQVLGHKKLASNSSHERYRLLLSDGVRTNSYAMLATQLNSLITDNVLTDFSICQINRYAMSMVNNAGNQRRVMVILSIELKVPGEEVGHKIGNPTSVDSVGDSETPSSSKASAPAQSSSIASENLKKPGQPSTVDSSVVTTPINVLTPYVSRWVIKARVISKTPIRTWSNSRGEGKLFAMDLVDETSEIRCTAFRDMCDKYYDMIEVGKVYYVSRCQVKPANKQFNHLQNDYELTMTNDTEVIQCLQDVDEVPGVTFHFKTIEEIDNKMPGDMLDILGVLKSSTDVLTFTARTTGRELKKRDITLIDESNTAATVTLWGSDAEGFNCSEGQIVALKSVRVGEFNNMKNLSTVSSSVMQIDPDIPQAHKLRGWYNAVGKSQSAKSLSNFGSGGGGGGGLNGPWVLFAEAAKLKLDSAGETQIYIVKAVVNLIRSENAVYKSCPTETCNKKVIDQSNQMYRCEKCNREYPNFKYRLLFNVNFCDWSGHVWATAFNDVAEKLIGITAHELGELHANDEEAYSAKFHAAAFSEYILKMRVKKEMFGDELRLRTVCLTAVPLDHKTYLERLENQIKELRTSD